MTKVTVNGFCAYLYFLFPLLLIPALSSDWRQQLIPDGSVYTGTYTCGQGITGEILTVVDWPVVKIEWFGINAACDGIEFDNASLDLEGREFRLKWINFTYNPCNYIEAEFTGYLSHDGLFLTGTQCNIPFVLSRIPCISQNATDVSNYVPTSQFSNPISTVFMDSEKCCAVCNADPGCRGWTSDSSGLCRILSSIEGLIPSNSTIYGFSQPKMSGLSACFCWSENILVSPAGEVSRFQYDTDVVQLTLLLCPYCPSVEFANLSIWCIYDGKLAVKGNLSGSNVYCPLPYLVVGDHTMSLTATYGSSSFIVLEGSWLTAVIIKIKPKNSIIGNTRWYYDKSVQISSLVPAPPSNATNIRITIRRIYDSAPTLLFENGLYLLGTGPYVLTEDVIVFEGSTQGFQSAETVFSPPVTGVDVAVQVSYLIWNGNETTEATVPWFLRGQGCYGHYCGDSVLCQQTRSEPPLDDLDAFCHAQNAKGASTFLQSDADTLARVQCLDALDVWVCLMYRLLEIQANAILDPNLIWPPVVTSSDIQLAASIAGVSITPRKPEHLQSIPLTIGRQISTIAVSRASTLSKIETGEYVPDATSRLGAYAATAGYPDGTVGNSVHRAIGTIYLLLGTFGEEKIGVVFNSQAAKALYSDSVFSDSNRAIATMEYNYWDGLRNTAGGTIATWFPVSARVKLQEYVFYKAFSATIGFAKGFWRVASDLLPSLGLVEDITGSIFGGGMGDPHFTNFDGCRFDFQGVGDFILGQSIDQSFAVHARFRRQSMFPKATMFSAIAIRGGLHVPIVELFATGQGAIGVRVNQHLLTLAVGISWVSPGLTIFWPTSTSVTVRYSSGIQISVSTNTNNYEGVFWYTNLILPSAMWGHTMGLLGNRNSNPYDDFVSYTDQIPYELSTEICEIITQNQTRINEWGYSFQIQDPKESLFYYRNMTNPRFYDDPSWIPLSPAEVILAATPNLVDDGTNVCQNLIDVTVRQNCLYDYIVSDGVVSPVQDFENAVSTTNKVLLLQNLTATSRDSYVIIQWFSNVESSSVGPKYSIELFDNNTWNVVVDSTLEWQVNLSLPDNKQQSYLVRVTVLTNELSESIVGVSQQMAFLHGSCTPYCPMNYCGGDSCGGTCFCDINACNSFPCATDASCQDLAPPALNDTTGRNCTCNAGYIGDAQTNCTEVDACISFPCIDTATCADLPPPALNTSDGKTCTCKTGYVGNGIVCTDIDACESFPCLNGNTLCTDLPPPADNTSIGRKCICEKGYTGDGSTCAPLHENIGHSTFTFSSVHFSSFLFLLHLLRLGS